MRHKQRVFTGIRYIVLCLTGILFLIPFIWMIVSSVKDPLRVFTRPIEWFPDNLHFDNYIKLFTEYEFHKYILNTVGLGVLNIIETGISCSLVSYGFTFCKYKHKNKIFFFVLVTMMMPGTVTFFPQFIMFAKMGWYGTMLPFGYRHFLGVLIIFSFYDSTF